MPRKPKSRARAAIRPAVPPGLLLGVFIAAIFVSAALLFAVQPMFTKLVLPRLGGSPSVWSVAMVFFQAVLLAGYAYAHFLMRFAPARVAVVVHVVVMLMATLMLPLAIATTWGRPPADGEALWLLGLFTVSIGLPFFALSANAPLLQAWFARTGHSAAKDPYFLYAASNIGSFLALLSYPFFIEPFARLPDQTGYWSYVFYFLILLIAACGMLLWRSPGRLPRDTDAVSGRVRAPSWQDAAIWVVLAAIPSGLLVAVTAYVSTDVAAIPLLWVIPLALYLATFVIVFARTPLIQHEQAVMFAPVLVIALIVIQIFDALDYILLTVTINAAAFFFLALVCHGELARRRPPARYLTSFYLWMSAGGVIGGIFAGLIAPNIFSWVLEYPLLVVLAILCRPGLVLPIDLRTRLLWLAAIAVVAVVAFPGLTERYVTDEKTFYWVIGGLLVVAGFVSREPLPFAAVIAVVFIIGSAYRPDSEVRETMRSFFGVHKITETSDGQFRVFMHGTTIHGAERLRDDSNEPITGRPPLITYYHENSPMGVTVKAVRARVAGPIKVAVVGLGTGTFSCFAEAGDSFTFYEIDASVEKLARDPAHFRYLEQCAPNVPVVLGDARLTLAESPDKYDLIVLDAFSSDAIPVHLMTREAMAIYLSKLAPHGIVMMHISNRHMELASVVAGIAHANGLVSRVNNRAARDDEDDRRYVFTSNVVIAAREESDFGQLLEDKDWSELDIDANQRIWTDDYSNIVGAIVRNLRKAHAFWSGG
jgi:hypothetical protein